MLSKTREDSGIKTVTLARGSSGPSLASSGRSSERASLPPRLASSPGIVEKSDPLRLLGSCGIVELLEHDPRPTFVVDVGDVTTSTLHSFALPILFANNAIRTNPSIWELVVGGNLSNSTGDEPTAHASNLFKEWLLNAVGQDGKIDMNPPPVEHGGIVWLSYTLRKRLRVISTVNSMPFLSSVPPTSVAVDFGVPSSSSAHTSGSGRDVVTSVPAFEPPDYFGSTVSPIAEDEDTAVSVESSVRKTDRNVPQTRDGDAVDGFFQNPDKLDLEGHPSFTNECVLRAQAAGEVDAFHRGKDSPRDHDVGFFDWTRLSITSSLPRHIQFARSIDWSSTPLGPIEYWSNDLRAMCNLIM